MATLPYALPSNLRTVTWSLSVGTPLGDDYVVAALTDGDPSLPLGISETSIDLRGDQGSAQRVDGVAIIHHNFQQGKVIRLQMHSDTSTWGGTTDVDLTVTVGAWEGRWAPHLYFNVAAAVGESTRTKRYLRITNTSANNVAIFVGELVVAGVVSTLTRGVRLSARAPQVFGRSINPSRVGVATTHDYRTRNRAWIGGVALETSSGVTDEAAFRAWQHDSYGVRPFLVWPFNDITDEPVFGRFVAPMYDPVHRFDHFAEAPFAIEELSCGEAY